MIQFGCMSMSAIGKLYCSRVGIEKVIILMSVFNFQVPLIPCPIPDDLNISLK